MIEYKRGRSDLVREIKYKVAQVCEESNDGMNFLLDLVSVLQKLDENIYYPKEVNEELLNLLDDVFVAGDPKQTYLNVTTKIKALSQEDA